MRSERVLHRVRRLLLGTLVLGIGGTAAELLLLDHVQSALQLVPLALLVATAASLGIHAVRPTGVRVRVLQGILALLVCAGAIGAGVHYDGNVRLALEQVPMPTGTDLFIAALAGTAPVLAPGTLALLGLIGFAYVECDIRPGAAGFTFAPWAADAAHVAPLAGQADANCSSSSAEED